MQRMFVGSSLETHEKGILGEFVEHLKPLLKAVSIKTWRDPEVWRHADTTLQSLLEEARLCDFAAFLFMKDDEAVVRQQRIMLPRDNVVLEAGLFLSQLSSGRVVFAVEKGAAVPSDLAGVYHPEFDFGVPKIRSEEIQRVAIDIAERWNGRPDISKGGFPKVLRDMRKRISDMESRISLLRPNGRAADNDPLILDSGSCQDAYTLGLEDVGYRFWTTTFLTSEFWSEHSSSQVVEANKKMSRRLENVPGHSVRRVFVLPSSPEEFLSSQQVEIEHFRDRDQRNAVEERVRLIERHRENILDLEKFGCDIRISFDDGGRLWNRLAPELRKHLESWDKEELAIFDDFRLDFYRERKFGVTDRLVAFTRMNSSFDTLLESATKYFEALWAFGDKPFKFLDDWREQVEVSRNRIQYRSNWLMEFDNLSGTDNDLKVAEMQATTTYIQDFFCQRKLSRYLDIGTCTGRYPISLAGAGILDNCDAAIGIDSDEDSVRAANANFKQLRLRNPNSPSLVAIRRDFTKASLADLGHFDLITCMFGTLSHFGVRSFREPEGYISVALKRMESMLSDDGLLVIGNWSEHSKRAGQLLEIYTSESEKKLVNWTPSWEILDSMLRALGLATQRANVCDRLDVISATRVSKISTSSGGVT